MHTSFVLLIALQGCADPLTGATSAHVVYGTDDRTEPFEFMEGSIRTVAEESIAMRVNEGFLDETDPTNVRIVRADTLGFNQELCDGERFADQISIGSCSGTLIDDRHILTAGHCTVGPDGCADSSPWLLGLRYAAPGMLAPLTQDDVYRCSRVVAYHDDGSRDYAMIELDRPVVSHNPVAVSTEAPVLGDALTVIGHPNGIPVKIAPNGEVTMIGLGGDVGLATVDAFSGNSGSGIFNSSGHLVAVLSGGNTDYRRVAGCNVVNVIETTTDGEVYTAGALALEAFCSELDDSSPACSCEGPCPPVIESDAGAAMQDAGRSPVDAGPQAMDAAVVLGDSGAPADVGGPGRADGGCSASRTSSRNVWGLCIAAVLFVFGRRCRRGSV